MKKWLAKRLVVTLSLCLVLCTSAQGGDKIGLILPYFEGEAVLAKNVPTVLFLQIWPSLRKAPYPNPKKLDFGDGIIYWANFPLDPPNEKAAQKLAEQEKVQMTLWGKAKYYGDGVAVQINLEIPRYVDQRKTRNEIWSIPFRIGGRSYEVEAEIPERSYEFASIALSKEEVKKLSSPSALKMYRDRSMKEEIGTVGEAFEAVKIEGSKIQVDSGNKKGWVRLPSLAAKPSEAIQFTGGIIRIFRGDWQGAIDLMNQVTGKDDVPTSIKVDAYLYQAYGKVKLGHSPVKELENAWKLSPNSSTVATYEIMSDLEELRRNLRSGNDKMNDTTKKLAQRIQGKLNSYHYLFPEDSTWYKGVNEVLNRTQY
jgi:hypothetical protein